METLKETQHDGGIVKNLEGPSLRPSALQLFAEDVELYADRYVNNNNEETDAMRFGTLVHSIVLQPEKFYAENCTIPDVKAHSMDELRGICKELGISPGTSKAGAIAKIVEVNPDFNDYELEVQKALSQGKKVIDPKTWKNIHTIKDKIYMLPNVRKFFEKATFEQTHNLNYKGVNFTFTPDAFVKDYEVKSSTGDYKLNLVIDLKITSFWRIEAFERSLKKRHIQFSCYLKFLSEIYKRDFNTFFFIAVEPIAPFRVRLYQPDMGTMDAAFQETEYYIEKFKQRHKLNYWGPDKCDMDIQPIAFKSWDLETMNVMEGESYV